MRAISQAFRIFLTQRRGERRVLEFDCFLGGTALLGRMGMHVKPLQPHHLAEGLGDFHAAGEK